MLQIGCSRLHIPHGGIVTDRQCQLIADIPQRYAEATSLGFEPRESRKMFDNYRDSLLFYVEQFQNRLRVLVVLIHDSSYITEMSHVLIKHLSNEHAAAPHLILKLLNRNA